MNSNIRSWQDVYGLLYARHKLLRLNIAIPFVWFYAHLLWYCGFYEQNKRFAGLLGLEPITYMLRRVIERAPWIYWPVCCLGKVAMGIFVIHTPLVWIAIAFDLWLTIHLWWPVMHDFVFPPGL